MGVELLSPFGGWPRANQLRQYEEPPVVAKRGLEGDPHTTYNTQEEDYGKRSVCWHGRR